MFNDTGKNENNQTTKRIFLIIILFIWFCLYFPQKGIEIFLIFIAIQLIYFIAAVINFLFFQSYNGPTLGQMMYDLIDHLKK